MLDFQYLMRYFIIIHYICNNSYFLYNLLVCFIHEYYWSFWIRFLSSFLNISIYYVIYDTISEIKFMVCNFSPLLLPPLPYILLTEVMFSPVVMETEWHSQLFCLAIFLPSSVTNLCVHRIRIDVLGDQYIHPFCTMFVHSKTLHRKWCRCVKRILLINIKRLLLRNSMSFMMICNSRREHHFWKSIVLYYLFHYG